MNNFSKPIYKISFVSNLLNIHPQTLRQYERENLISPIRINKIRLYSKSDIKKLQLILILTRDMGINLAGVEVVLGLKRDISDMTKEIQNLKEELIKINQNGSVLTCKSIVAIKFQYLVKV